MASQRVQTFIFFTRRLSRNFTGARIAAVPGRVKAGVGAAALLLAVSPGCGPGPPVDAGTYAAPLPGAWAARDLRPLASGRGRAARRGEVAILEGDATLVSGEGDALGLRFDEDRNDLGAVVARFVDGFGDRPGVLVLFTGFEDLGAAGPAYHVPIRSAVLGTGLGPLDQGATFGAAELEGVANLKRLDAHAADAQLPLLVHELAHQHLARLEAAPTGGATVAPTLLGRQRAHWHALLDTGGSLLGGHGFVETSPGRFVVARAERTLSPLDLYGLGLLPAAEVPPFFVVADGATPEGFAIPAEARLEVGARLAGRRVTVRIEDVVARMGRRDPPAGRAPTALRVSLGLLTAPGVSATASAAVALADRIDALRAPLEAEWRRLTGARGALCTRLDGCEDTQGPAPPAPGGGCRCARLTGRSPAGFGATLALLLGLTLRRRGLRTARP